MGPQEPVDHATEGDKVIGGEVALRVEVAASASWLTPRRRRQWRSARPNGVVGVPRILLPSRDPAADRLADPRPGVHSLSGYRFDAGCALGCTHPDTRS